MWRAAENEQATESQLNDYLEDWGLWCEESFDAWIIWRRSNYVVNPFAGGWFDQPWWIRADFLTLDLLRQWHDIQAEKPSIDGVKSPYDMILKPDD